jgi:capsular exopolysaccharide synthesis family protein
MSNIDPLDLPPPQEPAPPGSITDLQGVVRLVMDKRWLIVSCIVLAVIAAAFYAERAPRMYEATTTVQVEEQDAKVAVENVVSDNLQDVDVINTVAQKFSDSGLLEKVLVANNLLPSQGGVTVGSKIFTRDDIILWFSKHVEVTLIRNTHLINIAVKNTDPQMAAQLANSLVENYLGLDALEQQTTTAGANAFLQQEADQLKAKLEIAEQKLQDYRKQAGTVSLDQNQDIITPQLQDLNKLLTQSKADLVQAEGAYQDSLKMGTNIDDLLAYTQIATDPIVVQINSAVATQENNFAVICQRYREKNPKYILAASALASLKEQLADTVLQTRSRIQESQRIAYETARTAEQGLEKQLDDAKSNTMQLSESSVRFNVLAADVQSDSVLYNSVISRLGQSTVGEQFAPERIQIVHPATVPEKPVSPKIILIFALALFGGSVVGLGISFVLYSLDTSFKTVDEAEQYLSLPVLGAIPKLSSADSKGSRLLVTADSASIGAEVFRSLRTTLSLLGPENDRKICLFTSALPEEGKTFMSINYAVSLAQQGLRTLLVDMDLRRPMIESLFSGENSALPGITDYFLGRNLLNEICRQHKDVPNLSWIAAGNMVPNPAELLSQSDFQQLLNDGLAHYDRIVIDSAPVLAVSDTLLLAGKVQSVVLVVKGCKTSRRIAEHGVQLLKNANAPLDGIILNQLPKRSLSGYYYFGYGYEHYGRKESKDKLTKVAT